MQFRKNRTLLFFIFFGLILLIYFVLFLNKSSSIHPTGSSVSEKQLLKDLKILGKEEISNINTQIYINGITPELTIPGEAAKNCHIILINTKGNDLSELYEVRHAIRTWLYLQDHKLPYPVCEVEVSYDRKTVNERSAIAIITSEDFLNVYNKVKNKNQDAEIMISTLSDEWIKKTGYIRRAM